MYKVVKMQLLAHNTEQWSFCNGLAGAIKIRCWFNWRCYCWMNVHTVCVLCATLSKARFVVCQTTDSFKVELEPVTRAQLFLNHGIFFSIYKTFFIKTCKCLLCRCVPIAQTTQSALTHGNHCNFRHIQNVNAGPLTEISLGLSKTFKNFFCLQMPKKRKNKTCLKWNSSLQNERKSKRISPATCVITNSFVECTSAYSYCEFCRANFTFNSFSTPKDI